MLFYEISVSPFDPGYKHSPYTKDFICNNSLNHVVRIKSRYVYFSHLTDMAQGG